MRRFILHRIIAPIDARFTRADEEIRRGFDVCGTGVIARAPWIIFATIFGQVMLWAISMLAPRAAAAVEREWQERDESDRERRDRILHPEKYRFQ